MPWGPGWDMMASRYSLGHHFARITNDFSGLEVETISIWGNACTSRLPFGTYVGGKEEVGLS